MKHGWNEWPAIHPAVACLAVGLLAAATLGTSGCGSQPSPEKETLETPQGEATLDAAGVLDAMVAAYKDTSSYADGGSVRLYAKMGEDVFDQTADFSTTLVRPNKLRLHAYKGTAVCDGKTLWAFDQRLPGQIVSRPAPETITTGALGADPVLLQALTGGFAGQSPAMMLLTLEDPLVDIVEGAEQVTLLEPKAIGEATCDRVEVKRNDGTAVLWIDQQTRALRRVEYPTDRIAVELGGGRNLDNISMIADFPGAKLGGQVDPKAFAFEVPPDVTAQPYFIPPDRRQLLGNAAPPFQFVDLDGKPVTPQSLAGKPAVLDLWGMNCQYCMEDMPNVEKLYQKYKDRVVFLAVNVDAKDIPGDEMQKRFDSLKATLPIVRDTEGQALQLFMTDGDVPAIYLIGADGRVQDYQFGRNPNLVSDLSEKLDKLLAGENLYQQDVEVYQRELAEYKKSVEESLAGKKPEEPVVREVEIPRAEIAPHSEPKNLKLTSLWKSTALATPGNILVVPDANGAARTLVIDMKRVNHVVELGTDGKLVATHALDVQPPEMVLGLTTAAGADGKRYFVGTAVGQQRLHLFDEQFKLLMSYPEDALENRHAGIWTARPADLNGDGALELYVGYWGTVGLQAATLQGKRIWSFRRVGSVNHLAVGGPDAQGKRILWCTHDRGTLVGLDAEGNLQGEVVVRNRPLYSAFAANLTGDPQPQWCGLSRMRLGTRMAVGFDLGGKELWNYELPQGVSQHPIDPVIAGRLKAEGPGQWILPAADGSIHILAPDGKLVDRFNYGAALCGLATTTLGGKPALIVATPGGVEAWQVQ